LAQNIFPDALAVRAERPNDLQTRAHLDIAVTAIFQPGNQTETQA